MLAAFHLSDTRLAGYAALQHIKSLATFNKRKLGGYTKLLTSWLELASLPFASSAPSKNFFYQVRPASSRAAGGVLNGGAGGMARLDRS